MTLILTAESKKWKFGSQRYKKIWKVTRSWWIRIKRVLYNESFSQYYSNKKKKIGENNEESVQMKNNSQEPFAWEIGLVITEEKLSWLLMKNTFGAATVNCDNAKSAF